MRIILALAAKEDLELHLMDVSTAFPNEVMKDEVYTQQREGTPKVGEEHLVCRLRKAS